MAVESALCQRLMTPARRLALTAMPGQWFQSFVQLRCPRAAGLAGRPGLPGKIRGAFGGRLRAVASAEAIQGLPCPWSPPSALDPLFRLQGRITPALEIPKPYVLALLPEGDDLLIRLTLFGFASDWTEAAADALLAAVRYDLDMADRLEVAHRTIWSVDGIDVAPAGTAVVHLVFHTPCLIRQGQSERFPDFPELVATLGNRITGLSRWQDTLLAFDPAALKARAAGLNVTESVEITQRWRRFSCRQDRVIPMSGGLGAFLVEGELGELLSLLTLGSQTHAGSRAALGLGRYELTMVA